MIRLVLCVALISGVTRGAFGQGDAKFTAEASILVRGESQFGSGGRLLPSVKQLKDESDEIAAINLEHTDGYGQSFGTGSAEVTVLANSIKQPPALIAARLGGGGAGVAGDDIFMSAFARATFADVLTIQLPPPPLGPSGAVRFNGYFLLSGTMSASVNSTLPNVEALSLVRVVHEGRELYRQRAARIIQGLQEIDFSDPSLLSTHFVPFTFTVTPGAPYNFEFELTVSGNGAVSFNTNTDKDGAFLFDSDFSNTLAWGGITSVVDLLKGQPVVDWSVTSASGFDYSRIFPIPEPSTATSAAVLVTIAIAVPRPRKKGSGGLCRRLPVR